MDHLKKNKVLIAIVLTVVILVLIRSLGTDHFKTDAIRWAEPSLSRSNIISKDKIGILAGEKLFINLDESDLPPIPPSGGAKENVTTESAVTSAKTEINIPAGSILDKNNLTTITKHKGPVLLFSGKPEVSVRIWMLLSQLGYKNLYVLTTESDNEVLKYKFHPDTLTKADS